MKHNISIKLKLNNFTFKNNELLKKRIVLIFCFISCNCLTPNIIFKKIPFFIILFSMYKMSKFDEKASLHYFEHYFMDMVHNNYRVSIITECM
jgi:hypothetical protein